MIITSDIYTSSVYIKIKDRKISSQRPKGQNIVLDKDADGRVVGIEIIDKDAFFSNLVFFKWFSRSKVHVPMVNEGDLWVKKG